jgi:hypothetical protein
MVKYEDVKKESGLMVIKGLKNISSWKSQG